MATTTQSIFSHLVEQIDSISQSIPDNTYIEIMNALGAIWHQVGSLDPNNNVEMLRLSRDRFRQKYKRERARHRCYANNMNVHIDNLEEEIATLQESNRLLRDRIIAFSTQSHAVATGTEQSC